MEGSVRKWAWKDGWTYGRVHGFVPWSIFHKVESGNKAAEETLFFQNFGFGVREFWRSIDEPDLVEVTDADIYDARNGLGRFRDSRGRRLRIKATDAAPEETPQAEAAWKSFISEDELAALLEKERRAALLLRVKECSSCASGLPLHDHFSGLVHPAEYGFAECGVPGVHWSLGTEADWLPEELFPVREYRRLKDALEDDIRLVSSPGLIRGHSAYGKILLLGKPAVRLILEDLSAGGCRGRWAHLALADVTGEASVPETAWWLGWGHAKGLH